MTRILVIADDLSGAAEIASIGVRHGLRAQIHREPTSQFDGELTVIDTDTRHLNPDSVAAALDRFTQTIDPGDFDLIYKKTDSVLRGPLLAELQALMKTLDRAAALLVAQNPSRNRTIRDGVYRIDGTPLVETAFTNDPEYPTTTSNALELLGQRNGVSTNLASVRTNLADIGVTIGEASTLDDVRHWARECNRQTLPAGSADFFQSLLEALEVHPKPQNPIPPLTGTTLFVCGSASAQTRALMQRAVRIDLPIFPLPSSANTASWHRGIQGALQFARRALIVIDRPIDRTAGAAERLHSQLADAAARVLDNTSVNNLLLEGGATASAVCHKLGWHHFHVDAELAPGVAQMRCLAAPDLRLFIKPGSYAWPDLVFAQF